MNRQSTSAYQVASGEGATQAGLLQLVYSHLAKDLLRAASAVTRNEIENRCAASNHALLLLAHLESWLEALDEHLLAQSLKAFYGVLRTSILQLQVTPDASLFEAAAQLVLDTRAAWQAKEDAFFASSITATNSPADAISAGISFHA